MAPFKGLGSHRVMNGKKYVQGRAHGGGLGLGFRV